MQEMTLRVNGKSHLVALAPGTPLIYALRNDLGLVGTRFGAVNSSAAVSCARRWRRRDVVRPRGGVGRRARHHNGRIRR